MLNNLGLGFKLTADNMASAVFSQVGGDLNKLERKGQQSGAGLQDVSGEMRKMGLAMAGFGAAGVGVLGLAEHEVLQFGRSIGEVASITDRAAFPISRIEEISKEMASTYGGDINQQAKAFYQAVSSGATTAADATSMLHTANMLAVGGLSDSFKAIDAVTNVLNAYGMAMGRSAEVSDAMFVTAKVGKTTIDELASTIGRVAPTANAMGVSMDEMFAVVAGASTQLGNGTAAIDGLKESLANILKPTADAEKEAKRLGISFDSASLRGKGFQGFLASITQSAGYNKDTMGKLFGSMTAYNLMSALASNNSKALDDAMGAMTGKAGAAQAAFETMASTGDFLKNVLGANLQVALINLGKAFAPVIGGIMKAVNALLVRFNNAPPIVHKVIAVVIGVASAALLLMGGLLMLASGIAGVMVAGEALGIALLVVSGIAVQLFAAMLPLVAVGALLYLAWTNNLGGIADFITEWAGKIQLTFEALGQALGDGAFSGDMLAKLEKNSGIKAFAITVFLWVNRIKNFFVGIGTGIQEGVEAARPHFKVFTEALQRIGSVFGVVQDAPDKAKSKWQAFGEFGARVGRVIGKGVEIAAMVMERLASVAAGAAEGFKKWSPTLDMVGNAVGRVFSSLMEIVTAITGVDQSTDNSVSSWEKFGAFVGSVVGGVASLVTFLANVFSVQLSFTSGIIGAVVGALRMMWNMLAAGVHLTVALLTGDFAGAWAAAKDFVYSLGQGVIDVVANIVKSVAGAVDKIAGLFGVALNLKGKVDGVQKDVAGAIDKERGNVARPDAAPQRAIPAGGVPTVAPGLAAPVAAQAQQNAQLQASLNTIAAGQGKQPPIDLNNRTQLVVDGQVLADIVEKHQAQGAGRGFAPTEAPV